MIGESNYNKPMRLHRVLFSLLSVLLFFLIHNTASAAPVVDLKADGSNGPIVVAPGARVNLTWNNHNVISCTASGSWTGSKTPVDTGLETRAINKDSTFFLTCTDGVTSVTDSVVVRITPLPDDSLCNLLDVPRAMQTGQSFNATVLMRNNGTNTWIKTGTAPYHIEVTPLTKGIWGVDRDDFNETSVSPGTDGTFQFSGTAPSTPDTYLFEWTMMKGTSMFGQICRTTVNVDTVLPPPPMPPDTCTPFVAEDFADVPPSHPNYTAISCLRERYCVIAGTKATNFSPDRLITRGEVAAFMSKYHAYATKDWTWHQANPPSFTDVPFTYLFYTNVETSKFYKFISGSGGLYKPDDNWLYGLCGIGGPCPSVDTGTSRGTYIQKLYDYGMSHNQLPLCAPPTLTLSANPTTINSGEKTTINWTTTNADECTATSGSAGWPGAWPTNGSWLSGALTNTVTYTLTCSGVNGSVTKSVTVTVNSPPPPPPPPPPPKSGNLSVDLKADLGAGYVDSGAGALPLNDVDLKATVTGGGTGDLLYKFWCDINDTNPIYVGTVTGAGDPDIKELIDICDYSYPAVYVAKVQVTRGTQTAEDTVEIIAAKSCQLVTLQVSKNKNLAIRLQPINFEVPDFLLGLLSLRQ